MKIFIAGPRAIKIIDKKIDEGLKKIIKWKFTVLVGDANGMDKAIQQFFSNTIIRMYLFMPVRVRPEITSEIGQFKLLRYLTKSKVSPFMQLKINRWLKMLIMDL